VQTGAGVAVCSCGFALRTRCPLIVDQRVMSSDRAFARSQIVCIFAVITTISTYDLPLLISVSRRSGHLVVALARRLRATLRFHYRRAANAARLTGPTVELLSGRGQIQNAFIKIDFSANAW
jgi:hypothetical protein